MQAKAVGNETDLPNSLKTVFLEQSMQAWKTDVKAKIMTNFFILWVYKPLDRLWLLDGDLQAKK